MKRVLSIIFVFCIAVSVISGCAKQPGDSSSDGSIIDSSDVLSSDSSNESSDTTSSANTEVSGDTSSDAESDNNSQAVSEDNTSVVSTPPPLVDSKTGLQLPKYAITNHKLRVLTHRIQTDIAVKEQYERMNKFYDLEVENITVSWNDLLVKLQQLVASNDSPDVYEGRYQDYPIAAAKGQLVPITSILNPAEKVFDKSKTTIERSKYNGQYYAMTTPQDFYYYVFYNKKLFDDADLEYPQDLFMEGKWDWNIFLSDARELTDARDSIFGVGSRWAYDFWLSTGKDMLTINNDGSITTNFRDPLIIKAMNLWRDIGPGKYKALSPELETVNLFKQGKIGMLIEGNWLLNDALSEMFLKDQIGFAPFPKCPDTDYYNWSDFFSYSVPINAANPTGAAAFITYQIYESRMDEVTDVPEITALKNKIKQDQIAKGYTTEDFATIEKIKKTIKPTYLVHPNIPDMNMIVMWQMAGQMRQDGSTWITLLDAREPELDNLVANYLDSFN